MTEVDYSEHAAKLKEMAEELELWATRAPGRGKMVLGRMADEIREIARDLEDPYRETQNLPPAPDWVTGAGTQPLSDEDWEEEEDWTDEE